MTLASFAAAAARLARFALVGILGTLVYYAVLWSLVEIARVPVMISTSIAFFIVVIENYLLHYRWTFRSAMPHATAFRRFLITSIVGFCLNWAIMFVGVRYLALNYLLVQAVAIAVVVVWNFVLSIFWIFLSRMPNSSAQ